MKNGRKVIACRLKVVGHPLPSHETSPFPPNFVQLAKVSVVVTSRAIEWSRRHYYRLQGILSDRIQ